MWGSVSNQLRSVIEWKNPSPDAIFEIWSSEKDEIKNASKLLINPGQGCIFVYEGKVEAVYTTEGLVELKTANIPFWTTLTKVMQGFQSEHKVGIYFFKKNQLVDLNWGTSSVIKYEDPKYKFPVGLRAFGNFSIQIEKAEWFVQNISGVKNLFTSEELRQMMSSRFLQPLTDCFAQMKFSYAEIDSHRSEIAASLVKNLGPEFSKLGFNLTDFRIEGTSFDDDTMKRINRIADMTAEAQAAQAAGLNYAQLQQLEAMKEAAKNPGGGAGIGMGAGIGFGFGQQMAGMMGNINQSSSPVANPDDPTVKLKKIKELFDQGLITSEEFEAKKKDILSKI
jgi:membrane protease subunit (stomatin/prohibitin family)